MSPAGRTWSVRTVDGQTQGLKLVPMAPSQKVVRPQQQGGITRQRLLDRLAQMAAPVVWISAAPGAGKTSLAVTYCETSQRTALWYQVDSGDNDSASFFHFMRQAALHTGLAKAVALPLLPAEGTGDLAAFTRHYFRTLFAMLPPTSVLVFDNTQEAGDPGLVALLKEAFEQIPQQLRVLVLSQSGPPPALTRQVAHGTIMRMDGDELRFTREESDQVVRARLDGDETLGIEGAEHLRDQLFDRLYAHSAGWAAGLVLMIEHARCTGLRQPLSTQDSQAAVFEYFAGEIFAGCTVEEQRALMLSASLPRITARLARAASGHIGVERLLDRLHLCHLFVGRRCIGSAQTMQQVYELHALFKAFLCTKALDLPAAEVAEAARRAASLCELEGEAEEAIALYLAAADWGAAELLIVQRAPRVVHDGRWRTLMAWIAALPAAAQANAPWLIYWVGASQVWTDPPQARCRLEAAFASFAALDDFKGQVLSAGALSRTWMLDADWSRLDEWIDRLESLLTAPPPDAAPQVLLNGCARLLYITLARQPQRPRLSNWAERTSSLLGEVTGEEAGTDVVINDAVMAGYSLLCYFTWTGQTSRGEQLIRQIEPLTADEQLSPVSRAHWWWAQANHKLFAGSTSDALALIDRALALAVRDGLVIAGAVRRHRIAHLLVAGQITQAQAELGDISTAPAVEPYLELRAWLAALQGDGARALVEAQAALHQAEKRGRSFYVKLDHLLLAGIYAASGQTTEAEGHLRSFREGTAGEPRAQDLWAEFHASLIEANLSQRTLAIDSSDHDALRRALHIGSRQHFQCCWAWQPALMLPLLSTALEHGIEVDYCRSLIKSHRLLPASPDIEHWPWPVSVRSLGGFEVLIDGQPLRIAAKAPKKPLELLQAALALGGNSVAVSALLDALWPDLDGAAATNAFNVALHRLRKLLGDDQALQLHDGRLHQHPGRVWSDIGALERLLDHVPEDPAAAARRLLKLYRGHFLEGEPAAWAEACRERQRGRFRRVAIRLAEMLEQRQRFDAAIEFQQRAIEIDPLAEPLHCGLLRSLLAQDRRAEALQAYQHCNALLLQHLGVAPSAQTRRLIESIG